MHPHCELALHTRRDLTAVFGAKVKEFVASLADIHRAAQADRSESREELDSILNLVHRLDFNDFLKETIDYAGLMSGV